MKVPPCRPHDWCSPARPASERRLLLQYSLRRLHGHHWRSLNFEPHAYDLCDDHATRADGTAGLASNYKVPVQVRTPPNPVELKPQEFNTERKEPSVNSCGRSLRKENRQIVQTPATHSNTIH